MTDNNRREVLKSRLSAEIYKRNYLGVIDALSPLIVHE